MLKVMNLTVVLDSVVPMLVSIFQMQQLIIVCDWNGTSLDLRRNLYRDTRTVKLIKSLNLVDKKFLIESNLIMCASTVGKDEIAEVMKKTHVGNPWVILHNEDDGDTLPPSGINQLVYFYNGSLYEMYSINSVVVTRQLDIQRPLDDVYQRRADMHGLNLNIAVNPWERTYGVKRESDDIATLSSGDEFYRLRKNETFGLLEDFLSIMSRELNFTIR